MSAKNHNSNNNDKKLSSWFVFLTLVPIILVIPSEMKRRMTYIVFKNQVFALSKEKEALYQIDFAQAYVVGTK